MASDTQQATVFTGVPRDPLSASALPMTPAAPAEPPQGSVDLAQQFQHWLMLKDQATAYTTRANLQRDRLSAAVQQNGYTDESGHERMDLDAPLTMFGTVYTGVQRQRRVSTLVNEDRVRALAERLGRGALDLLFPWKRVLDESAIYLLHQRGDIDENEVDRLFDRRIGYAFVPVKA